jgi:hypothetical protein
MWRVAQTDWVLLAYRMPREPSTPRISVWRKLRKLGAVQLVDGLVALPADPATVEAFDWLADEVVEAGGEAWTWRAQPGSKQQQAALRERVAEAVTDEYRALIAHAAEVATDPSSRALGRMRRELRAIEGRDRFRVAERDAARRAVERLATKVEARERTR